MIDTAKELLTLAERCREIREWHKTGLLCDGALRKLAAEMPAHDEHVKLRLAEDKTAIEAMDAVVRLSARQQAAVEEVATSIYLSHGVSLDVGENIAHALLAKYDIFEKAEG